MGEDVHCGRPGLPGESHRAAGLAVEPLVELPFGARGVRPYRLPALAIHLGEPDKVPARLIQPAGLDERGDVEAANEGPCAAVVVVVRQVEITNAVIVSPVA